MRSIKDLAKPYIYNLKAYSSARSEFTGTQGTWLDANENNMGNALYGEAYNRYPDPMQLAVKEQIAKFYPNISPNNLFLGNGSDEALDLLFRIFIEAGKDAIAICSPTYGMYGVLAESHNAEVIDIPLNENFQLNLNAIEKLPENCKILFLCSPNNPTGNVLKNEDVEKVLVSFPGIVVMDEAYIHFAKKASWVERLSDFPNLLITQTFSKAHALAALRIGIAFAHNEIISLMNKVKMPYNMNASSLNLLQDYLNLPQESNTVKSIIEQRNLIENELKNIQGIDVVFPSDANFILFTCQNSNALYLHLRQNNVVIRNREKDYPNALRVSIGKNTENESFIKHVKLFYTQ